jgi:hypothetical protein
MILTTNTIVKGLAPALVIAALGTSTAGASEVTSEKRFADGVRVTHLRPGSVGSLCGARRFCVWADVGFEGIQASFPRCSRNRPKTYDLTKYGLPPGKPRGFVFSGVSSYRNNMGRGYTAQFLGIQGLPLLRVHTPGGRNMPRSMNDEAAEVDMLCVP